MKLSDVNVDKCIQLANACAAAGDNESSLSYSLLGILMTLNKPVESKPIVGSDPQLRIFSAIVDAAERFFTYPSDEAFKACNEALDEWDAFKNSGQL